jgi:OOP family OmpA-OmpF porin
VRSISRSGFFLGVLVTAAVSAVASPAFAQSPGLALDRFEPAPAGDRMFGVPSPYAAGELTPHVMLLGDYANNPLVLHRLPNDTKAGGVVKNQLYLNLDVGLSLWNRLNLDVDIPVALYQNGGNPQPAGQTFATPSSTQFGDLRLGARLRLFGEYHDPFQIAVGGYVWLPTANKNSYVGTGDVRGLPQLILGGRGAERVVWSAAAGPELQGKSTFAGIQQGSMFHWGAGIGFLLLDNRHLQIGPEASGDLVLRDVQKRTTNAEVLLDARYRLVDDVELAAGAGPGLTSGVGTPDFRAVLSLAYTPEQKLDNDRDHDGILDYVDACPDVKGVADEDPKKNGCPPERDRDHDGILDDLDACPDVRGVADEDPKKNGCPPERDRDHDGILDDDDACPDVKGVADEDPKKNGCPPERDRDHDGILDDVDACPDVKGVADPDPKKNGCPLPTDTDKDGIIDDLDACPTEKGPRNEDPKKNGCPVVHVTNSEIIILEQVQFDTNQATIKKVSDQLLDQVAAVLTSHDEITQVEVQGHTDSRGAPAHNKQLSQARAQAVVKALVKRGVAKERLTAKGYGQDVPIADNDTDDGRQQNRRVQFAITEKSKGTP